ncbi:MAG TPA: hypothetical protein VN541_11130 [Tepidisphaeraceae bacterium]|nr:hypothetical protein [Tepidisphaeraceae bacterium]
MVTLILPFLLWLLLPLRRASVPDEPCIVGISPKPVFVQNPGYFSTRRFREPRRALRDIRIDRYRRTSSKLARRVVVEVDGRLPVSLGHWRTEKEINEVAEALCRAKEVT